MCMHNFDNNFDKIKTLKRNLEMYITLSIKGKEELKRNKIQGIGRNIIENIT